MKIFNVEWREIFGERTFSVESHIFINNIYNKELANGMTGLVTQYLIHICFYFSSNIYFCYVEPYVYIYLR